MNTITREVCMKVCIDKNTKTTEIMDRFDGIGSKNPVRYSRLILVGRNYGFTPERRTFMYYYVVERGTAKHCKGDITFTNFKQGNRWELENRVREEVNDKILKRYKGTDEVYYFKTPFILRAQNSLNRTGYGWEWEWGNLIREGTLYGETNNYVIAGIIIL